jgi:hypothetical protein
MAAWLAAMVATGLSGLASAQTSPSATPNDALSADDIYDRAKAAVAALPQPAFLAYTADFTFDRKGHSETAHERILLRTSDGHAFVRRLPGSPGDRIDAKPHVVTQGAKDDPATALPLTTFGLRPRKSGGEFLETPATPEPDPSGMKVVAAVRVYDRVYDVSLAGEADAGGRVCYHLMLIPRTDPEHHRIRELYVDATTFVPQRYVIQVYAVAGPVKKSIFVTCDAAVIGGYTLLTKAETSFTLRALFVTYGGAGRYAVRDVSFPAQLPDWLFDPDAYPQHKDDPIPD